MKNRGGVPEAQGVGPSQRTGSGTSWRLTRRVHGQREVRYGYGATAFAACASIGWGLSELVENPEIASEAAE